MDYHFFRDKVAVGAIVTLYMPTTLQVVDVLTKALGKYPFLTFRSNMGVEAIPHATLSGDDNERNHHQ